MKKNMGKLDRGLRTLVALGVVVLLATGAVGGVPGIVLGVVAVAFLITSGLGFCPLYAPFGLSTCRRRGKRTTV